MDDLDGGIAETIGDRSVFRGPEPKIIDCKNDEEMADAISTWVEGLINNVGIGTHEICITPANEKVLSNLENKGIKTLELKPRQRDPGLEEQGVRYGTKKRIKGLEFKAVALITESDRNSKTARFADYVASTRAREHLLLVNLNIESAVSPA